MAELRDRFRQSGASPIITSLGWNEDLAALPDLTFEPTLAVGCDEAQASASLSVDSGGLVVNTADAVTAGADSAWEAGWWLGDPVKDPIEAIWRAQALSSQISVLILSVGFGVYYLEDGETIGANPPGASDTWAGAGVTAYHRVYFEGFGESPANYIQATHRAVRSAYSRYPGVVHAESRGSSYASLTGFNEVIKDPRTMADALTTPDAARFRPALTVRRISGNGQLEVRFDELQMTWQPETS